MSDLIPPHGGLTEPVNRTREDLGTHPKRVALSDADLSSLYRIGDGSNCCVQGGPQQRWGMFSFPLYERLKAEAPEFEQMAAFQAAVNRLGVRRQGADVAARPIRTSYVTGNYFPMLGVRPAIGRLITPADDRMASPLPIAVLSWNVWKNRFALDPAVVGRTIRVEDHPLTIVGVTPPGFFGIQIGTSEDIFIPFALEPVIRGPKTYTANAGFKWLQLDRKSVV